jgi:hypothetical protein
MTRTISFTLNASRSALMATARYSRVVSSAAMLWRRREG